ncbi:hypothetical protein SO694_00036326 [Aureococcus anophagefferens]|uniref:Uncharacterized protein n=1 Tax=Aureococcus anophagefferens TaxID=44056 RepID=A0ABR1FLC6_AURAN
MNLGERSTQSLPTLLRRDSLQAEMGLFAFSGSHSSGGFTQGGESALDFRGSGALLAGPLAPLGSDAAPPLRHTYALLKGPPGIGARPFLKRLPHQAPPSAHGRNKKDVTIFESEESLRQVQLAATRVEERKMEQARRRDAARFKREENTKLERKRLMAALEERRTRTDRAEAAAKRQLRATLWLALLHGGCFARASGRGLGTGRKRIAARRWQHAAVAVVQRLYRARAARLMWHRFACYARLMRKQRLRMCLHVRCFKRWHAMNVVNNFLLMFAHDASKLQMLVMRFTTKVYLCQALARRHIAFNRARIAVLGHLWHAAEASAMQAEVREVNEKLAAARAELQAKLERLDRQGRGMAANDGDEGEGPPVPLSPRAAREKRRKKRKQRKDASSSHARILAESEQFAHKCRYKDDLLQDMLARHREKYDAACEQRKAVTVLAALVDRDDVRRKTLVAATGAARPHTAPGDLGHRHHAQLLGPSEDAPPGRASLRRASSQGTTLKKKDSMKKGALTMAPPKAVEYLPKIAHAVRHHLLAALLIKRKRAWLRRGDPSRRPASRASRASRSSYGDFDDDGADVEPDGGQDDSGDEDLSMTHAGSFTAGDARKWLKIDAPGEKKAGGSPAKGDTSALLMGAAKTRYSFFNSFGGAAGMRAAVKQKMLEERARMAAIQDAIYGPVEERGYL